MARLQFRSATQSKGFAPIQLSKASLSEMEKRDAKLLKALESKHAAEMQQRETNLQAMRENDEYTQRRFRENREIEIDNLQREQSSLNQIAERDRQQAQYDQQATETIISSIIDFSSTAAKTAARRTAQQLVDQTRAADAVDLDEFRSLEHKEGINLAERTGILNSSKIEQEDAQAGVPPHQTKKNFLAEKGLGLVGKEKLYNRLYEADYEILLNKTLQDTEEKFQLPNGRKFSGADVENSIDSPEMFRIVARATGITVSDLMRTNYGVTERHFFTDARGNIQKQNEIRLSQYSTKSLNISNSRLIDIGDELIYSAPDTAYKRYTQAGGHSLANKKVKDAILKEPDQEKRERLGAIIVLDQKGNSTTWKGRNPNTFDALSVQAEAAESKRIAEQQRQRQVDYNELIINNQDNLIEAYRQNPAQAASLARQQAREIGNGTVHPIIVSIESAQLKANEDELVELQSKANKGELSKADVNASSYSNRKAAGELYIGQQGSIYGESEKAITDGLIATARDITGIVGDGPNSVQTLLVHAQLKRDFLTTKQSDGFENPLAAWEEVKRKVAVDKENLQGKYFKKVEDGRISLPNIETPDKEDAEMFDYAQTKMLSDGTSVVDQPFVLDTPQGMDRTYKSSTIPGQVPEFSAGIREYALKYGFSFIEVFNRQRTASNAAMGENKPLIKNPVLEQVKAPDISNLIFNKHNNKTQSIRGARTADRTASGDVRPSMGGGNPTPQQVYDYMRSKGVSNIHAKGIVANNAGEAFMTPDGRLVTASVGDNGMSGGLFQMYDDRYRKMEQAVPDWRTNWRGQIDHALQDDSAPQYLQMKFADEVEAANWFMENFERPAEEHRPGRRDHNRTFIQNLGF